MVSSRHEYLMVAETSTTLVQGAVVVHALTHKQIAWSDAYTDLEYMSVLMMEPASAAELKRVPDPTTDDWSSTYDSEARLHVPADVVVVGDVANVIVDVDMDVDAVVDVDVDVDVVVARPTA